MNMVERTVSEAAAPATEGAACLNCAAPLSGPFCAECGQRGKVNRTLGSFFADLVSGMLNFEGKLWHTLPLLAWRPGELTRRYVDGQRVRFVSPVALYLFTVFLMFAVLGFTGALGDFSFSGNMDKAVHNQQLELQKLEQRRASAVSAGQDTARLDRAIKESRSNLSDLEKVRDGKIETDFGTGTNNPAWVRDTVRKVAANPQEAATRVQDAASKYSWLLIPFSVPVLRLLFPFRRRRLYDHTVFATYSLSFMMFLVIAGGLLVMGGMTALAAMLLLIPPVHMYRQLRGAYGLRWWDAALRTFVLVNAALLVLLLWFIAIAALGVIE